MHTYILSLYIYYNIYYASKIRYYAKLYIHAPDGLRIPHTVLALLASFLAFLSPRAFLALFFAFSLARRR